MFGPSSISHSARRRILKSVLILGSMAILFRAPWMNDYYAHREAVGIFLNSPLARVSADAAFSGRGTRQISSANHPSAGLRSVAEDSPTFPDTIAETSESVMVAPDIRIRDRLLSLIDGTQTEILVHVYLLTEPAVVDSLIRAYSRGVRVRVILEHDPYELPQGNRKTHDQLLQAGIPVFSSKDDFAFVHAKYAVSDGSRYVFATGNFTKSTFSNNREFFVFGDDPIAATFLQSLFLSDFRGSPFVGSIPDRFYLAPIDARSKILSLIETAQKSITVLAPSVSDGELVRYLRDASLRGRRVRVCLGSDAKQDDLNLFWTGIAVTVSKGPYLHAKTLLVDEKKLLLGSANFTQNSLDENREIGAIFSNPGLIRNYETMLFSDCKW